ncbi:hypothetical protein GUJ93_ZPchr0013g37374 [Zizania palustris]|uniref:Rad60/SUMO-like domain-containing protein n=1 Tax=Zizania palustris TaxID=103762 RepID=A0A8J5X4E4_ZIZPA|nr:hypothetical protein GUJ93_ZPchr0013g37374 [Zizania palustris]
MVDTSEEGSPQPFNRQVENSREKLIITIQEKDGQQQFRVYKDEKFDKIFKAYAKKAKLSPSDLTFVFEGDKINPANTPEDLGLEDDDMIEHSSPINVASLYAAFDHMAYDPICTSPAEVTKNVTMEVVEAVIPENTAIDLSESTTTADIIAPSDVVAPSTTADASYQSFIQEFLFDIGQYLQDDEVVSAPGPAMTQLSLEVRGVLSDIMRRLGDIVETLVNDSGAIHGHFNDVLPFLSSKLVDVLMLVLEIQRAQQRMAYRVRRASQLETAKVHRVAILVGGTELTSLHDESSTSLCCLGELK